MLRPPPPRGPPATSRHMWPAARPGSSHSSNRVQEVGMGTGPGRDAPKDWVQGTEGRAAGPRKRDTLRVGHDDPVDPRWDGRPQVGGEPKSDEGTASGPARA